MPKPLSDQTHSKHLPLDKLFDTDWRSLDNPSLAAADWSRVLETKHRMTEAEAEAYFAKALRVPRNCR